MQEVPALSGALDVLRVSMLWQREGRERLACVEVRANPEALERGEIVRPDGDDGIARIGRGPDELAVRVVRKIKRPRREHTDALETRADFVRHGAQVLANHHAAVALALEREDPEKIVERITHIRARAPPRAGRPPVRPPQP